MASPGRGLFPAIIGLRSAGLVADSPATQGGQGVKTLFFVSLVCLAYPPGLDFEDVVL